MNHIEIGDKYIKANVGKRMYARGVLWGYDKGVWKQLPNAEHEIWVLCKSLKENSVSASIASSIFKYVTGALYVLDEELDNHFDLLNLRNGVLDLKTLKLLPHSPRYYFTTQLGFEYDSKAKCPQWRKFLSEVLIYPNNRTDESMVNFAQEAFGYSLTASVEHEVSFWMIGEGANGKSTICYILDSLAGSAALHLNLGMLDRDKYQLAQLGGKRVVLCTEAPDTTVADSTLKAVISGDPMNVRNVFEKPFVVKPIAKVWWAMNNPPRVSDTSEGFWRKMKVIPMHRVFDVDERDKKLRSKLREELPGIFNWALDGLRRLESAETFTECDQVEDATVSYRNESDLPAQFVSECCVKKPSASSASSDLYSAYRRWCKENGHRAASSNRIGREWKRLGFTSTRESGKRVWAGLEVLSDETILDLS